MSNSIDHTVSVAEAKKKMLEDSKVAFEGEKAEWKINLETEKAKLVQQKNDLDKMEATMGKKMADMDKLKAGMDKKRIELSELLSESKKELAHMLKDEKDKVHTDIKTASSTKAQFDPNPRHITDRQKVLEELVGCQTGFECYVHDAARNVELAMQIMDGIAHGDGSQYRRFQDFRMTGRYDHPLCLYAILSLGHRQAVVANQDCLCPNEWPYDLLRGAGACKLQIMPVKHESKRTLVFIFEPYYFM
ncbi:hypothetical protein QBC40DRAFT_293286 [Triangularia verruculosa]|uniref:Uncharacterized protein n=1 Tax=Triangularia verruculosa TaxID=2587418 RepID=A0AAN6XR99_9PEZI|nr:hypothetical protein QBC40DRAFT_293286 [Triangularia verruculosa]